MGSTLHVFEDYVYTATGAATTFYTSTEFVKPLGLLDQLAIECRAEQGVPGANPAVQVRTQHSADGRRWQYLLGSAEIASYVLDPITPDNNVRVGLDDGTTPMLSFVRLEIQISAAAAAFARVSLKVTMNDVRENAFASKVDGVIAQIRKNDPCKHVIQGGVMFKRGSIGGVDGEALWRSQTQYARNHNGAGGYVAKYQLGCTAWADNVDGTLYYETSTKRERRKEGNWQCVGHQHGFKLMNDARLCIGADGSAVLEKPGAAPISIPSHPFSSNQGHDVTTGAKSGCG